MDKLDFCPYCRTTLGNDQAPCCAQRQAADPDTLEQDYKAVQDQYAAAAEGRPGNPDGDSDPDAGSDGSAPAVATGTPEPGYGASKASWLDYAESVEEDDDAKARLSTMSRDELRDAYGTPR